jgi:hypothetical protein
VSSDCVTLWIGDTLGPVERACLRSIARHHKLALYCYRAPAGVPDGIELRDAAAILPVDAIFAHRSGSFGPFADWFRYELQRRSLGIWVDADMYLLAPLDADRPYLFGEQSPGIINNAVLRLPADAPIVPLLLKPFEGKTIPAGLPWRLFLTMRMRQLVAGEVDFRAAPWGSTGPYALSALIRRLGLSAQALPREVLYPVPWRDADWIRTPGLTLDQMVIERTVAIHLWNECIKGYKNAPAPNGSFLQRLQDEGRD